MEKKELKGKFFIMNNNFPVPCAKPQDSIRLVPIGVQVNIENEQADMIEADEGEDIYH
jgi:hypothetical protein